MSVESVLFVVIGGLIGVLCTYWTLVRPATTIRKKQQSDISGLETLLDAEKKSCAMLSAEKAALEVTASRVPELEEALDGLRGKLQEATNTAACVNATLESERQSHLARVTELQQMGAEIESKFAALASEALGQNAQSFLALVTERFNTHKLEAEQALQDRQNAIETLVTPINDSLTKFEHKVGEIERARIGAYEAITEQVKSLADGQLNLRSETSRLVQALRRPKTRGRWGEYQLRNVLEMAGMTEHVDFVEERTIDGTDGRLRPDVIVRLPGDKSIVVDAKTPLDAYLAAVEATDEQVRDQQIAQHARQVREHIRALASREYWKALPVTPDFVVMFVPGEAFFAAAIESDPGLFEHAVRQRVLISTPTTFIALVKAIAYGWQQEKLTENAQAVAGLARELYDRIKIFAGYMNDLGRSLRQAVDRYNKGVGSLEGRVLPAVRKFEALGVVAVGSEIEPADPIELDPRALQAMELQQNATEAAS